MPGAAPESGDNAKMSLPPGPAASIMPSEVPNRILRGSKLATTTMSLSNQRLRIVGGADAGKDLALAQFAHIDAQLQQLVGAA